MDSVWIDRSIGCPINLQIILDLGDWICIQCRVVLLCQYHSSTCIDGMPIDLHPIEHLGLHCMAKEMK
jgi:hypothetical protein